MHGGNYNPKNGALDLMGTILDKNPDFLQPVLQQIYEQLENNPDPLVKESLLLIIGHLKCEVIKSPEFLAGIETLLQQHAYTDLTSDIGYLRA